MQTTRQPGLFYGWIMVATALAIIALGMGLMFSLGVGLYVLSFLFGSAGAVLACWLRAPQPLPPVPLTPQTVRA